MPMKSRFAAFIFGTVMALGAIPASGATASTSFSVSATVLAPACAASVSSLQFGRAGEQRARAEVSVRCAHAFPYTVTIDAGQLSGLAPARRELAAPDSTSVERASRSNPQQGGRTHFDAAETIDGFDLRSVANWDTARQTSIAEEASSDTIIVSVDY